MTIMIYLYPYEEFHQKNERSSLKTSIKRLKLKNNEVKIILDKLPYKDIEPPIFIMMVWRIDDKDKWFKGRVLRKTKRKQFIYDISYGKDGVWTQDLSKDFYSSDFIKDNWYFLEEDQVKKRYV